MAIIYLLPDLLWYALNFCPIKNLARVPWSDANEECIGTYYYATKRLVNTNSACMCGAIGKTNPAALVSRLAVDMVLTCC